MCYVNEGIRLEGVLGKGGMGVVYAGEIPESGEKVAVKVPHPRTLENEENLIRFFREAKLSARINSPFVARLIGFRDDGPVQYVILEQVAGTDLATDLFKYGPWRPRQTAELIHQLALGLDDIHAADIVHGDIKPANIMVSLISNVFHVKIIDFGVARGLREGDTHLDSDAAPSGTPSFMSPEQIIQPRFPTRSWDLWALACLTYETLTGYCPYPGESVEEQLEVIKRHTHVRPSQINPELKSVDVVFKKAFAKDIYERFQTASEFSACFNASLDHARRHLH